MAVFFVFQLLVQIFCRQPLVKRVDSRVFESGKFGQLVRNAVSHHAKPPGIVINKNAAARFNHHMVMLVEFVGQTVADFDSAAHTQMPDDAQAVIQRNDNIFGDSPVTCNAGAGNFRRKIFRNNFAKAIVVYADSGYIGVTDSFLDGGLNRFDFR